MQSHILLHLPKSVRAELLELGQAVKGARIAKGFTQNALAARLKVSPTTIRAVESGDPAVAAGIWAAILWVLGISAFAPVLEQLRSERALAAKPRQRARTKRLDDF